MNQTDSYIGKVLLIGLTYFAVDGTVKKEDLGHGTIVRANEKEGIVVRIKPHGNEFKIPPDFNSIRVAPPGEYKESATGMTILNPDFITFWEIHDVAKENGGGSNWKPRQKVVFQNEEA